MDVRFGRYLWCVHLYNFVIFINFEIKIYSHHNLISMDMKWFLTELYEEQLLTAIRIFSGPSPCNSRIVTLRMTSASCPTSNNMYRPSLLRCQCSEDWPDSTKMEVMWINKNQVHEVCITDSDHLNCLCSIAVMEVKMQEGK